MRKHAEELCSFLATRCERLAPMTECPHLVIGMMGRCESCFESVVEERTGPRPLKPVGDPSTRQHGPDAVVLRARWAARFGEPEDYRKAMEELRGKEIL